MALKRTINKDNGTRFRVIIIFHIVLIIDKVFIFIITVVVVVVVEGMGILLNRQLVQLLVSVVIVDEFLLVLEVGEEVVDSLEDHLHTIPKYDISYIIQNIQEENNIHREPNQANKHLEQSSSKNCQREIELAAIVGQNEFLNEEEEDIGNSNESSESSRLSFQLFHFGLGLSVSRIILQNQS